MSACQCGCGELAPIATRTNTKWGHQKGQPVRFIVGHHFKTMKGEQHSRWMGDDIGYAGAHVRARKTLAGECHHCGESETRIEAALRHDGSPSARRYCEKLERSYSLDTNDYLALCVSCHHSYDGFQPPPYKGKNG